MNRWGALFASLVTTVALAGCPQPTADGDDVYDPYKLNVLPASQPFGLRPVEGAPELALQDQLCSDDGWCRIPSAAPVSRLTAGLALGADTWFVGGDEALLKWDGSRMQGISLAGGPFMRTIAGEEDDFFLAGGRSTVYHYDGSALRQISTDTGFWSYLISEAYSPERGKLWAVARDEVDVGVVIEYDGETWGVHLYEQPAGLSSIDGRGPDDIWIVGDIGVIWHYGPEGWEFINSGTETNFSSVHVTEREVWIGGWGGLVMRYDGDSIVEVDSDATGTVTDIWEDGDGELWAASADVVMHYDGERFAAAYQDDERLFHRGLVDAAGTNLILDEGPVPLIEDTGASLMPLFPVSSVDFHDVVDTPAGLIAVGARGSAWRNGSDGWAPLDLGDALPEGTDIALRGVTERDGTLFIVGDRGTLLVGEDGALVAEALEVDSDLVAVASDSDGNVWMVGHEGVAIQRLPTGESLLVTGPWSGDLHAVRCDADGTVWIAGDDGVFRSNGASFVAEPFFFEQRVLGLARVGDELWAVGQLGTVSIRDASGAWRSENAPTHEALHDVVAQGDDVVVVGRASVVVRYPSDGAPTTERTDIRSDLNAAVALDGAVVAVGDDGVALVSEP